MSQHKYKVGFRYKSSVSGEEYEVVDQLDNPIIKSSTVWYQVKMIHPRCDFLYTVAEGSIDNATMGVPNATTIVAIEEAREMSQKYGIGGVKYDHDKTQYQLVPPTALKEVAGVLTFGARKYAPWGFRNVHNAQERYTAAALRHIEAYRLGETNDPESNLHHLAHAICCLMFKIDLYKLEGEKE